jgi:ABC-type nitrate/sulfonate/bicarbonate transport system substrate-binding protein
MEKLLNRMGTMRAAGTAGAMRAMRTDVAAGTTESAKQAKRAPLTALIALLIAALALALGACAAAPSATDSSAAPAARTSGDSEDAALKKVTLILDWTPNTNHSGIFAAESLGYYEESGLDVSIEQAAEGTVEQLISAGRGEFGISMQEVMNYALTQDDPLPIKAVAAIIQHNTSGFVSLKEDGIKSPADWTGKTYGGWAPPQRRASSDTSQASTA